MSHNDTKIASGNPCEAQASGRNLNPVVRILYLIRGVPGSGKTTYAKTLGIKDHYEADMWFDANGGYNSDNIALAHEWCQLRTMEAMEAGRPCVVSNTFIRLWEMEYYKAVAERLGYEVREVVMRGEWQNVHGVPEDKVRQMRERFEYANPAVDPRPTGKGEKQ